MPPKKAAGGPSKKTVEKKKDKVIEDKTFGLKNKKGAKTQKFVQQVQHQIKGGGQSKAQLEAEKLAAKKKAETDDLMDLNKLLKPVVNMPKVSKDTDPKSIVCAFFKQGMCGKGAKCKFSHDLSVEQKTAKRNLYVDNRELKDENMDDWDAEKLTDVAEKKHGENDRKRTNQTDIVCKYFIEAVENSKYGWFWECPNGTKCIYRHALPPGYVLKKDRKKMEDQDRLNKISLEELIEKERAALNSQNLVKVTLESFIAWKKQKLREKKQKAADDEKVKRSNFKSGKQVGLSGRDLFTFNPELLANDDDEAEDYTFDKEEGDDDEENVRAFEIDENTFNTFSVDDLYDEEDTPAPTYAPAPGPSAPEAKAKTPEAAEPAQPGPSNIEINEDLFDDEDLPDDLSDDEGIPEAKGIEKLKI